MHVEEQASNAHADECQVGQTSADRDPNRHKRDSVFLHNDRIYCHQLARFNYTTYDVRRAQDVTNPRTSHCDIMLLARRNEESDSDHPFIYARVLGIYHANVLYTGTGMVDHQTRRIKFLWVRWFEYDGSRCVEWKDMRLDALHFPPVASEEAFGFVDPKDVLRGCHIIPAFVKGKRHSDGIGISRCARDGQDWVRYHVNRCVECAIALIDIDPPNRFVDRDMLMRYHWGLGVGHVYSHGQRAFATSTTTSTEDVNRDSATEMHSTDEAIPEVHEEDHDGSSDAENPELGFDDLEDDWIDEDSEGELESEVEEEEFILAMDDMYGSLENYD
jgi:hypothetical protein